MSSNIFPLSTLPLASRTLRRVTSRAVQVQEAENGKTYAIRRQLAPRRRWAMDFGPMSEAAGEVDALARFVAMHGGRADTFLLKDPKDYQVADQGFGIGDGVTAAFQLQRAPSGSVADLLGTWPLYSKRRSNLLRYSQDLTNASWTKEAGVSATASAAVAPNGTVTACTLTFPANSNRAYSYLFPVGTYDGITITFSVWLRAAASTTATLALSALGSTSTVVSITTSWQRFSLTRAFSGTGGGNAYASLATAGAVAQTIEVWGLQAEASATATRYIPNPTGSAVNADPYYWPSLGDGFEPVYEPAPGAIVTKDGVDLVQGTGWTLGVNGLVTPTVLPAAGAQLAWSGSFYRRCRFASNDSTLERIAAGIWRSGSVEIVEDKP